MEETSNQNYTTVQQTSCLPIKTINILSLIRFCHNIYLSDGQMALSPH